MLPEVSKLKQFIVNECSLINSNIIERERNLDSKQLICYLSNSVSRNGNNMEALTSLQATGIINVTRQAVEKKLELLTKGSLDDFLINFRKHIYENGLMKSGNLFAVDGTKIAINKNSDYFKLTGNGNYKLGLVNTIYSLDNKIPIAYDLTEEMNEIKSFIVNLIKYVKENDTVVFDRGYYSVDLINTIHDNGSFFVCRMKKSSLLVKYMEENDIYDSIQYVHGYGIIRTVKYVINNNSFYMSTNEFRYDIDYFKKLYHDRWQIEEFYKTIKCNMGLIKMNSIKILNIHHKLITQFIVATLARYLEELAQKYVKKLTNPNRSINHKKSIFLIGTKTIILLLYRGSIKKILNHFKLILKDLVNSAPNRHFKRTCIRLLSNWYLYDKNKDLLSTNNTEIT